MQQKIYVKNKIRRCKYKNAKTMNNAPKRHLRPLSRGHNHCRVHMTLLLSVSVNLKIQTFPRHPKKR